MTGLLLVIFVLYQYKHIKDYAKLMKLVGEAGEDAKIELIIYIIKLKIIIKGIKAY